MADQIDMANDLNEAHTDRAIATARASAPAVKPFVAVCHACGDEDVPVLHRAGMLRCTDCRAKLERRR